MGSDIKPVGMDPLPEPAIDAAATTDMLRAIQRNPSTHAQLGAMAALDDPEQSFNIAHNHCPVCGLVTREAKFCPYDGVALEYVAPTARCANCTEQIVFANAQFCGWCGTPLEAA